MSEDEYTEEQRSIIENELQNLVNENRSVSEMNQRLEYMLEQAKKKLAEMRDEMERLTQPPNLYVSFLSLNDDGTAEVISQGRRMRCHLSDEVDLTELVRGRYLTVNDQMVAIELGPYADAGEICKVVDVIDGRRLIIEGRMDERKIIYLRDDLKVEGRPLKSGDEVLVDPASSVAMEYVYQDEAKDALLEVVPDVTYDKIGGAEDAIEVVHDSVELPYKYPEIFAEYELTPPRGMLLYGPPGCGKTMIAKAIANSLAAEGHHAQFMNISGPELLTKWVGESERKIRELFATAREKATPESPVVIFFDEAESMFRMRGSGRSSDMESTIVPTLLAELDGVEELDHVLVIFASNRQDLIDPAVLRPGRIDIKIQLTRPNRQTATDIIGKYLHDGLRVNGNREELIEGVVDHIFDETVDKEFLEVVYSKGTKDTLYFKDFISGAMLENIVARGKKDAVKRAIVTGNDTGIELADLLEAVNQEFHEIRDLPNTTDVADWQKITGRSNGDEIVKVRSLAQAADDLKKPKIEDVANGQYL